MRKGAVLRFKGRLGDERLQLGLPDQWAAAEQKNVPGSRSYCIFGGVGLAAVEPGEIGVRVHVQGELTGGLHDRPFVARRPEVADDGLDGGRVALAGVGGEASDLADGEGDVGTRVGGQVQKHADDGRVAPLFTHRRPVGIRTKGDLSGRKAVRVTVLEPGDCGDLLDEPLLGEGEGASGGIALKLDPEVLAKVLLLAELEPASTELAQELIDGGLGLCNNAAVVTV